MAQEIESEKLFIKDIFTRWYTIPTYQRPYVWNRDNVTELLDDIMQARNNNKDGQYFLGSMVLRKNKDPEGEIKYTEYELLDGQQRTTTLLLIMAVIRDLTIEVNGTQKRIDNCKESIYQSEDPDDGVPERMRIKFLIRKEVSDFVDEFVKEDAGTSKTEKLRQIINNENADVSIRNMANSLLVIRKYFTEDGNEVDDFYPYLRSNVLMIYVAAEDLDDAFRLFTVMNSRGMKLRNSDILKANNLAEVKDDTKQMDFAREWEENEKYFGESFDNFLSHIRSILVKRKASYNLVKEFDDNIYKNGLLNKGEESFKLINRYVGHYKELFDNDYENKPESYGIYNRIKLMEKGFEADFWMAPLLRYYDKFGQKSLDLFLKKLEHKYATDWMYALTPTKRIESMNKITQRIDNTDNPELVIKSEELNVDSAVKQQIKVFLTEDVYKKRFARYIMLKLDSLYLGDAVRVNYPVTISIEHILPQKPSETSEWRKDFTENELNYWVHKLGNLILLSRRKNSTQNNRDYNIKKQRYFSENIEVFSNSVRVMNNYNCWKPEDISRNHKDVIEKLSTEFELV